MNFADVNARARGQWRWILGQLGVAVPDHRHHGPCPVCHGSDRFRCKDEDGEFWFWCNQGGEPVHGDAYDLLHHAFGWSPAECLKRVNEVLGGVSTLPLPKSPPRPKPEGQRQKALEMWLAADRNDAAVAAHPYCRRKLISHAFGAGVTKDLLVIPIRKDGVGKPLAVQTITETGEKRTYGCMDDGYLLLGNTLGPDLAFCVEGWADAFGVMTSFQNAAVAISFGLSRLEKVALLAQEQLGTPVYRLEDG